MVSASSRAALTTRCCHRKGKDLLVLACLQKTSRRAAFPPWNHPGTGEEEEEEDASEKSLLSSAGTGDTSPGVQGLEFRNAPFGKVGFKLPAAAELVWVSLPKLRTKI